jgi:phage tail-like protein
MAVGNRNDPFGAFNFLVEIDGITRAAFRDCSGLDSSQQAIEYREGGEPLRTRKIPGLNSYSNITLTRGITTDAELWDWRQRAADGRVERKNGSIILLDDKGEEKIRWNFSDAWPIKWTGPTFNATGNDLAVEVLELAHEGLRRA